LLDDSYNANPASMSAALDALADQTGGARIAVLGSMFELGVAAPGLHHELGASVARRGLNRLVAMGPNAADMAAGAREAGLEAVDTPQCHEEAARLIASLAKPGDLALVKGSRGMRMETIIEMLREILMAEP
jgi:UDP-N-acetylmuramyl pentapeptide synthase